MMRFVLLILFLVGYCFTQNTGISRMQELRTKIDPIRTFDLPEEAPRARIISVDFLKKTNRKIKPSFRDNSDMDDFKRWRLDELTDRDMRSSKEVKNSAKSPFGSRVVSSEENIGEFFPTRLRL